MWLYRYVNKIEFYKQDGFAGFVEKTKNLFFKNMIPYTIITICATLAILIFCFTKGDVKPFGAILFIPILITCCFMDLNIKEYKLYPINYKIFKTPVKIICDTDYVVFESDKIIDLEHWNEHSQGYLILGYNFFKIEKTKQFTTTPHNQGITYSNEHN